MIEPPQPPQDPRSSWISIGLGCFFVAIAILFDPIGPSPDTGVFDLGSTGTRCLIGLLGGVFLVAGLVHRVRGGLGR